jgi:hypothetical protein
MESRTPESGVSAVIASNPNESASGSTPLSTPQRIPISSSPAIWRFSISPFTISTIVFAMLSSCMKRSRLFKSARHQ